MSKKILTMMDIKKARDGIAAAYGVDTLTASRLVGFYNGSGDVETVAALVAGDYSSIPSAAAALSISLQGVGGSAGSVGDDRPAIDDRSTKKLAGSVKKDRKNDTRKAETAHNSDILTDTARNRKADKIPADSKSKPIKAKKAVYNDSIPDDLTPMDNTSRPESVQLATITADTIKSVDTIPRADGDILPADTVGELPENVPALIMDVITNFCEQNNIADLSKERQPKWGAACYMVGSSVFKKSKILHDTQREKIKGGIVYDVGRISALVDLWGVLCQNYCKAPLIDDFARFAAVSDSWLYGAGSQDQLTPARALLLQKIKRIQENGLAGLIVDGRQNPTGALAALNHYHGWTQTREIIHTSGAAAPVAPSLPVFDGAGGLLVDSGADSGGLGS